MQLHDLLNDGQAQPGPAAGSALSMPETIEDVRTILNGHAGAPVTDADAAFHPHPDLDGRRGVPVDDGVLHQIAHTVLNRMEVSLHHDGRFRTRELDLLALGDRQRRHGLHHLQCHRPQIRVHIRVHDEAVQACHVQQLLHQPVHAGHILTQLGHPVAVTHALDGAGDDRQRGRIERAISQLEFSSFVASFTNDDNRFDVINAGNPELEPEQTWQYELVYERQLLNDMGVFSVTALYEDVSDYIGRIPLQVLGEDGIETLTAPGNMGDGYSAELAFSGSLRLDRFNLPGAVVDLGLELQKTEVIDPFTGEKRGFNFRADYEWSLAFRQDLGWRNLSYGLETRLDAARPYYDLNYWQESEEDLDLEMFVQMQPFPDMTLRLEADNLLRAENPRQRWVYEDNRADSPLRRYELRSSQPARQISLSLQWVF